MPIPHTLVSQLVTLALGEDLNYQSAENGDITAQLIPANEQASAKVITREDCIFCGKDLIIEVFKQVDP
ncbi:nicotinate-nucleotide diphosphorylase, partial [Salmonella enterica]|nr:nicotinate-nucleotide diphosphorylase [Salmonella enterica]